ncbi:MAG: chemotaxis protein CheW [Ignavibacterium sp.]|nr:chemotaxis protein CheW [Ignavibacterium sp.]MCX7612412.1 chemotaxis protein CheW [Ignavibacterium sp.]MDW8375206.1 chemotaxis protein CheW [Ignavibacteriales bacterium]
MKQEKKQMDSDEILQLVSFNIGNEEFGIDILKVEEIIRLISITKIPNAPDFIEGVINLRGKVIPVIDLRTRLKREKKQHDNNTRVIVVEVNGRTVGFIVDSVREVLRVPKSITEPPPSIVAGVDSEYITAIGKLEDRLLILLDLEKVLSHKQKEELAEIDTSN